MTRDAPSGLARPRPEPPPPHRLAAADARQPRWDPGPNHPPPTRRPTPDRRWQNATNRTDQRYHRSAPSSRRDHRRTAWEGHILAIRPPTATGRRATATAVMPPAHTPCASPSAGPAGGADLARGEAMTKPAVQISTVIRERVPPADIDPAALRSRHVRARRRPRVETAGPALLPPSGRARAFNSIKSSCRVSATPMMNAPPIPAARHRRPRSLHSAQNHRRNEGEIRCAPAILRR